MKAEVKVKVFKMSEVKPYWHNARNIEKAVEAVKASIQKYGYAQPISIDKDNVIITGHSRYKALMELGYDHVACVVKDDLTEEQVREYRIADNKTGELATWKEDELAIELRALSDPEAMEDFFKDDELTKIIDISVGQGLDDITDEDVKKSQDKLGTRFDGEQNIELVAVTCPECGEEFSIQKADFFRPEYQKGKLDETIDKTK